MITFSCSFLFSQAKNKKGKQTVGFKPKEKKIKQVCTRKKPKKTLKLYNMEEISLIQTPGKILVKVLVHKEKELSKH